eukprot:TRINITY_DN29281_c0_g1_i1.p1 TRINITY_DN29281_c0_g1~~TRINITY_DN29281_c0_g1_i1.p1  ORF type:complete len:630 (+),score=90.84 TRINITY_DN29281_c0_g1_i1:56-1945(+)
MTARLPEQESGKTAQDWQTEGTNDSILSHAHGPRRRIASVAANFISAGNASMEEINDSIWRRRLLKIVTSFYVEFLIGVLVLVDLILSVMEIDAQAKHRQPAEWIQFTAVGILIIYLLEFLTVTCALGWRRSMQHRWLWFDFFILVVGVVEIALQSMLQSLTDLDVDQVGLLRILRVVRVARVMKLIRKFRSLLELRKLLMMFVSCLRTLTWTMIVLVLLMILWAMVAVEFVHPVIEELGGETDQWEDCSWCNDAMSSVMNAVLTLFMTIVAGDSWGMLAMPVIKHEPLTAVVFVGSMITLVFGLLNLVVAVVVDTFAEQRARDVLSMAEDMENDHESDKKRLKKLFSRIDNDGSGDLNLNELIKAAHTIPEFRSRLRVMDIDIADLEQLFHMLDCDSSGTISSDEFVTALSRWLVESKTATRFVKYNVMRSMDEQIQIRKLVETQTMAIHSLANMVKEGLTQRLVTPGSQDTRPVDSVSSAFETVDEDQDRLLGPVCGATSSLVSDRLYTEHGLRDVEKSLPLRSKRRLDSNVSSLGDVMSEISGIARGAFISEGQRSRPGHDIRAAGSKDSTGRSQNDSLKSNLSVEAPKVNDAEGCEVRQLQPQDPQQYLLGLMPPLEEQEVSVCV